MAKAPPHLTISKSDDVHIVEFTDRKILEELVINEIGEELSKLVEGQAKPRLLLSFQNVDHLSSAALGMLIKLHHEVQAKDGKLRLSQIGAPIFEVFKITRLNKLFDIYDTTSQALTSF